MCIHLIYVPRVKINCEKKQETNGQWHAKKKQSRKHLKKNTLPETNSSPLKINAGKMNFLFGKAGRPIFRSKLLVLGEGSPQDCQLTKRKTRLHESTPLWTVSCLFQAWPIKSCFWTETCCEIFMSPKNPLNKSRTPQSVAGLTQTRIYKTGHVCCSKFYCKTSCLCSRILIALND